MSNMEQSGNSTRRSQRATLVVCDIDNTLKQGNKLKKTEPVPGMLDIVNRLIGKDTDSSTGTVSPSGADVCCGGPARQSSAFAAADPKTPSSSEEGKKREGGELSVMRAVKLVYLTNRYSPLRLIHDPQKWLDKFGFPHGALMARDWTDVAGFCGRDPGHKKSALWSLLRSALPPDLVLNSSSPKTPSSPTPFVSGGCRECQVVLVGDSGENDPFVYTTGCEDFFLSLRGATLPLTNCDGNDTAVKIRVLVAIRVVDPVAHKAKLAKCLASPVFENRSVTPPPQRTGTPPPQRAISPPPEGEEGLEGTGSRARAAAVDIKAWFLSYTSSEELRQFLESHEFLSCEDKEQS